MKQYLFLLLIFLTFTGCTTHKLYSYKDYPCENTVFTIEREMILVTNGTSAMKEALYYITRNSLEEYNDYYLEHRDWTQYIEKKIYPIGSEFEVVGYYWPFALGYLHPPSSVRAYLVQSLDDKNIAWISHFTFNSKDCHPQYDYDKTLYNEKHIFEVEKGTHQEKEIGLSKLVKKPFE